MRVILDTNVLISALISPRGASDLLYQAWRVGHFVLVSSEAQLEEFSRVSRYARLRPYLEPSAAGTMLNEIKVVAAILQKLPKVDRSQDSADNYILAMAEAGKADYLVAGDKAGLLQLKQHAKTKIVTVRKMVEILRL